MITREVGIAHRPGGSGGLEDETMNATVIAEEIAAEIIDGGQEACEDYLASNGQHYRWSD